MLYGKLAGYLLTDKMENQENIKTDHKINITNDICPMTFVKTKLKLETMQSGEILEVILRGGEPLKNVPKSVNEEGHTILQLFKCDEFYRLIIKKK